MFLFMAQLMSAFPFPASCAVNSHTVFFFYPEEADIRLLLIFGN
jgi:hypothetical protein